jgi:hypothetical protein
MSRTVGLGWTRSRACGPAWGGLYLKHCSVPRYDGSCICICLLTGLGSHHWRDILHCRTAEVAPERSQDRRLDDGSYSFGYSILEMVKLSDVWEELPDISIYCQKQNVSNLYHFDMALYPDL